MRFFMFMVLVLIVVRGHGFIDADKYICRCEKFAFQDKPFVAIWNSPTNGCDFNFSTPINLKRFGIIENDHQTWDGRHVTVFASAQLGLYPYFILNGEKNYNGGLPQHVDLGQHLRKARKDIELKIPDPNYSGLAVIDWEQWRPLWDTNWDPKKIYKVKSVDLVRSKHPDWGLGKILEEAKKEFEESARALFEHTITIGKELRPKALWGFYGFPDCYGNEKDEYQCVEKTKKQNDQLEWLFSASSALFPSMYLQNKKPGNHNFVLGRLRETLRFAAKGFGQSRRNIPIFVYHRNIYDEDERAYNFLQKADLDNTIAVSADLGTAGVVIWGNRFDENTSPEVCRKIENYVYTTLGPYLQTKFQEVQRCASINCHNHGHCVDKALLTPELLKRYQTAQGSKHNCSQAITAIPSKLTNPVRSEIPTHHSASKDDDASHMLQTLRDRNREITEAFQASQNGLSRKMGEFFDAMYTNTSIANSTGVHNFNKNGKKTVTSQDNTKHDFSNLQNFREKEFVKEKHSVPMPKVKEVEAHPPIPLSKHQAAVKLPANKVVPPPAVVHVNKLEPQTVTNGKKSESPVTLHLPNPNSLTSPRRPELVMSSQDNISKGHTPLHVNKGKPPNPSVSVNADKPKPPEALHKKKTEPPKARNDPKPQQTPIGKKSETLKTPKEKKPKPPATLNMKKAELPSTVHIITPKAPKPLHGKNIEGSSATGTLKSHHPPNVKNLESSSTPKTPHPLNAKNLESPSTPKTAHPLNSKNLEPSAKSTPKAPQPLNAKNLESAAASTSKVHHPLNAKNLESAAASTSKAHHPLNAKNLESSPIIHGNKSKSLTAVPVIKLEPVKIGRVNTSKPSTLNIKKSNKSTILNINKGDSSSVPNVKKSDIPKLPKKEKSQMEMTLDLGTENEQRSSLEVLGQSSNVDKSVDGVKSSHYAAKDHNSTEDIKASRKSEIAQGSKFDTSWMIMPSKVRHKSWIPHIYVVLIGISIAGALMFSLMFVAAYYYVSLRHHPIIRRESVDPENDTTQNTYLSPKGHSSPISSPNVSKGDKPAKGKGGKDYVDISPNRKQNRKVKTPTDDLNRKSQSEININVDSKDVIKPFQIPSNTKNINVSTPSENEKGQIPRVSKKVKNPSDIENVPASNKKVKTPSDNKTVQTPGGNKRIATPTSSRKIQRSLSNEATPRSQSSKLSQIPSETSGEKILAVNKERNAASSKKRSRSSSRDKKVVCPPEGRNAESQTKTESLQKLNDLKAGPKPPERNKKVESKKHKKTKIPTIEDATAKKVIRKQISQSFDRNTEIQNDVNIPKEHKGSLSLPSLDVGEEVGSPDHGEKKSSVSSNKLKQNTTLPELVRSKKHNTSKDVSVDTSEVEIDINNMR